jgi:hypothetical protein
MKHLSRSRTTKLLTAAPIFALLTFGAMPARANSTVVVSPPNMDGWTFDLTNSLGTPPNSCIPSTSGGCIGAMVFGPGTPPLGVGSARLATPPNPPPGGPGGDQSAQIRNSDYAGVRLSQLTELSFCTWMTDNSPNGQQFPYLTLFLNLSGNATGATDDEIFFEPPYQNHSSGNPALPDQGTAQLTTWQCWNALEGGWWSNNSIAGANPGTGVQSLATYQGVEPNAVIVNPSTGPGGVRLAVGFASGDDHFDGNVDKVIIGVNGVSTTYDFEPLSPAPTNADQCKKNGWMQFNNPSFSNQGQCVSFVEHQKH